MKNIIIFFLACLFWAGAVFSQEAPGRFTDNGDGTVTDTLNGVMWAKDPDYLGTLCRKNTDDLLCGLLISKKMPFLSHDKAQLAIRMMNLAGHKDWRLPDKEEAEILNLIGKGELKSPFGKIHEMYWTSTPGIDGGRYWMSFPVMGFFVLTKKNSIGFVWPVRDAGLLTK